MYYVLATNTCLEAKFRHCCYCSKNIAIKNYIEHLTIIGCKPYFIRPTRTSPWRLAQMMASSARACDDANPWPSDLLISSTAASDSECFAWDITLK